MLEFLKPMVLIHSFFFPLFLLYYGKFPGIVRLPEDLRNHHSWYCNTYAKDNSFLLRKNRACRANAGEVCLI